MKSDLPSPGKCPTQPLLGSLHNLLHCPALKLTYLAPGNLEQSAQASRNYSSSGSLSLYDQAYHNNNSSNSLGPNGQFFHSYSILVHHYNHPDAILCTCCKVAIVRSSVEPVYFPRTILANPGPLAHFSLSSYLRLSTMPTKPAMTIGPPYLEPKPFATSLTSHYLKWTQS